MILDFLDFLKINNIDYRLTNGYKDIFLSDLKKDNDHDILFKKSDFLKIDSIIKDFCKKHNSSIVQVYHQELLAKNFFIYNKESCELLNLDLYGEVSRKGITILYEKETFKFDNKFKGISILKPQHEFIHYLIKKIDKQDINFATFDYLCSLYDKNNEDCNIQLNCFFGNTFKLISKLFIDKNYSLLEENLFKCKEDFLKNKKENDINRISNYLRVFKRIIKPTGITICFLGPDGSGKSTIIHGLLNKTLPFRRNNYFHLKPIKVNKLSSGMVVSNPHASPPYSKIKSFVKLVYYFFLYNVGWIKNVLPIKIKSSLVIFDRYYDDILVDHRRFRYGGSRWLAKLMRVFIPRPDIYFILTTDSDIIYKRKQEVSLNELNRQIILYRGLGDGKRYFNIDVNREPKEIVEGINEMLMNKMNERY